MKNVNYPNRITRLRKDERPEMRIILARHANNVLLSKNSNGNCNYYYPSRLTRLGKDERPEMRITLARHANNVLLKKNVQKCELH